MQNWVLAADSVDYLAADQAPGPLQHFWSLGVEEQFYLFWPLLVLGACWLSARTGRGAGTPARLERGQTRIDRSHQELRINQQRQQYNQWQRQQSHHRNNYDRYNRDLSRHNRHNASRYYRDYWQRWLAMQLRWRNQNNNYYYNNAFYYSPYNYQYSYGCESKGCRGCFTTYNYSNKASWSSTHTLQTSHSCGN